MQALDHPGDLHARQAVSGVQEPMGIPFGRLRKSFKRSTFEKPVSCKRGPYKSNDTAQHGTPFFNLDSYGRAVVV